MKILRKEIKLRTGLLLAIGILLAGMASTAVADDDSDSDSDSDRDRDRDRGQARYQTANVWDAVGGPGVNAGAAWLVRERNEISGRIMANVPQAGLPYTVWFIVVNNPSACNDPFCLFGPSNDFGNPTTRTTTFNATGAIAADNGLGGGVVNADVEVEAGRLPNDWFVLEGNRKALRRGRGFKALVWLVIDQHPPLTSAESWISDLTTTHPPGAGPNATVSLALFLPCTDASCPDSAL